MKYIEINKRLLPYKFNIELDRLFTFTVYYNAEYDYFTVDLADEDGVIVRGERLVYGRRLFEHLKHLGIPTVEIRPYDKAGKVERIAFENMNEEVFLYVGDGEGDAS